MPRLAIAILLLPTLALAAPAPPERAEMARPWGTPTDPDGGCRFHFARGRLRIVIPGKPHALSAEIGLINAPRVMRQVDGDFAAEVRVLGRSTEDARSLMPGRWPFNGAGLLVWQDGRNYLRLERARIHHPKEGWRSYPGWELRQAGVVARGGGRADGLLDEARSVHLRLARKGDVFTASVSQDRLDWKELPPLRIPFGRRVQVGVTALQNTPSGFEALFEKLTVTPLRGAGPR